jgi:hypothetical protein
MTSTVLFVPLEDTYPVNSVEEFSIRSKLKMLSDILKYFETINVRVLQDLRFHSDFFIKNIYPRNAQSYYILTTSSKISDSICSLRVKTNDEICVERINNVEERRVSTQQYPNSIWTFDSFTGEYLLGILANQRYPKGTLKYYGGFTCDNWNYIAKEPRCLDFLPLQSEHGIIIGAYSLLSTLKAIMIQMGELSWGNLSVNFDATIKVGNFTRTSYQLPNGITIQTVEVNYIPPLGKRVITLMLLNDKLRPYLLKEIENFFQNFSQVLRRVIDILPENRLHTNVDMLLQDEMNDNTPEIESYFRRCL